MGPSPSSSSPTPPLQQGPPPHQGIPGSSGNTLPSASHLHDVSAIGSGESDHRRHWMPKIEFPRFDGIDVHI
jgi:hypothetical protein